MKRLILVMFVTLFSGCGQGPRTAYYTQTFDSGMASVLERAVADIEASANTGFMHDPESRFPIRMSYSDLAGGTLGMASSGGTGCIIEIDNTMHPSQSRYDDVDRYQILLHEIGHCMGLGHSENAEDIMYPYYIRKLPANKDAFTRFNQQLNKARGVQ